MIKNFDKKQFVAAGLAVLFLLVTAAAGFYYFRYSDASAQLSNIRRELQISQSETRLLREDLKRAKTEAPGSGETDTRIPSQERISPLDRLATSTREALLSFAPFSEEQYISVKELGDNLVVVIESPRQDHLDELSAWFVDFEHGEMRRLIGGVSRMCNYLDLEDWSGGIAVHHSSSPCEAVGKTQSYYFDKGAKLVAETEVGTFDRDGTEMDAVVRGSSLKAKLIQAGNCRDADPSLPSGGATTTISGISVNGRAFSLPTSIQVECSEVYGGGFDDYYFPGVEFDGERIKFHLPGYDAAVSSSGNITFSALPLTYTIPPYTNRIVREDSRGFQVVRQNIKEDPIFEDVLKTDETYRGFDFIADSFNGRILKIRILKFNYPLQRSEETGITVEYDTETDTFQNLTVN